MNHSTIATFAGAACLLLATMAAQAGEKQMEDVGLTLSVQSNKGRVLLHAVFENVSAKTVYVPRALATEKELFGRQFEIKDAATGEVVTYQGIMVKRSPMGAADYLALKPHGKVRNTIDITDSYAFKRGEHVYELSYEGGYLRDLKQLDKEQALRVAGIRFTHTAK